MVKKRAGERENGEGERKRDERAKLRNIEEEKIIRERRSEISSEIGSKS